MCLKKWYCNPLLFNIVMYVRLNCNGKKWMFLIKYGYIKKFCAQINDLQQQYWIKRMGIINLDLVFLKWLKTALLSFILQMQLLMKNKNGFITQYVKCHQDFLNSLILFRNHLCAGALKTNLWSEELHSLQTTIQATQVLLSLFWPWYKSIKGIRGSKHFEITFEFFWVIKLDCFSIMINRTVCTLSCLSF